MAAAIHPSPWLSMMAEERKKKLKTCWNLVRLIFCFFGNSEFSHLLVHLELFTFSFTVWAMNILFLHFVNLPIFLWAKCPSNFNFHSSWEEQWPFFFHYYYHRPGLRMLLFMTSRVEPIMELQSRQCNIPILTSIKPSGVIADNIYIFMYYTY